MSGFSLVYTSTRGTGTTLVRNAIIQGINFQFNTGHGFYRTHNNPSGVVTNLHSTGLTPDIIEIEISHDILAFLSTGGSLPQPNPSFTGPLERNITVNSYQIGYRVVQTKFNTISVSTYFLIP
ncbi:hypothetical protein [Limnofasciculus baicalensis]|uniref:Uncharacterized protein n=1 Tax=Limnofasciculus baicalensis BBK-W-15 TaxID=2699891 RepID=A0AAE3GTU9_9CYAN|nr:hypothetical protein [Limnofasciculus baicalensis]MCP2730239.1 hypothetical protein [Limnofasciculus baicalensis BBK-W-15]